MTDAIRDPNDIKTIEAILIGLFYDVGTTTPDGEDTDAYRDAVKQFQTDHNLEPTGIVDKEKTLPALNAAEKTIAPIKETKTILLGLGYDIGTQTPDYVINDAYFAAVKAFQTDYNLEPTGIVDKEKTLPMLNAAVDDVIYEKEGFLARLKNTIRHPSDPYADFDTTTYSRRGFHIEKSTVISGEKNNNSSGIVTWMGELESHGKPALLFDLSIKDPRYKACKEEAERLKKQYPLDGLNPHDPRDFEEITRREKAIVIALTNKIHEQYGDYNEAVAKGANSSTTPSMHEDVLRAAEAALRKSPPPPPKMADFNKNELICRQYGSLASSLCDIAGIKNFNIGGSVMSIGAIDDELRALGRPGEHAYVVSRLTGNIIDATASGEEAYGIRANALSLNNVVKGASIITEQTFSDADITKILSDPEFKDMDKDQLEEAKTKLKATILFQVYNTGAFPFKEMEGNKINNFSQALDVLEDYDKKVVTVQLISEAILSQTGGCLLPDNAKSDARKHGKTIHAYGTATAPERREVQLAEVSSHDISPANNIPSIPASIDAPIKHK